MPDNEGTLVQGFMSPHTVGRLIASLQRFDPATPVFKIEVGNVEGRISWTRKETWKKWLKSMAARNLPKGD